MTCNLLNNQTEIVDAFRSVAEPSQPSSESGAWCLLDYDGQSNIVRVAQRSPDGGLPALVEQFHSGHVQYGFFSAVAEAASEHQHQQQRKVIMIHWVIS